MEQFGQHGTELLGIRNRKAFLGRATLKTWAENGGLTAGREESTAHLSGRLSWAELALERTEEEYSVNSGQRTLLDTCSSSPLKLRPELC
jgi:hypothetical protein